MLALAASALCACAEIAADETATSSSGWTATNGGTLAPIAFCGDASHPCGSDDGLPVTRTLTITNRGLREGILAPTELVFAPGQAFVRLRNESAFDVDFSGNLTGGRLLAREGRPAPDEITLPVGLPGTIRLSPYPGEVVETRLRAEASDDTSRVTYLRGTVSTPAGPRAAELILVPDDGVSPVAEPNAVSSIDACVARPQCFLRVLATFRTYGVTPGTVESVVSFRSLDKDYIGQSATFMWDGATRRARIDLVTWNYRTPFEMRFEGTPDGLSGESFGQATQLHFAGSVPRNQPLGALDDCVFFRPGYAYCLRPRLWAEARAACQAAGAALLPPKGQEAELLLGVTVDLRDAAFFFDARRKDGESAYRTGDGQPATDIRLGPNGVGETVPYVELGRFWRPLERTEGDGHDKCLTAAPFDYQTPRDLACARDRAAFFCRSTP